MKFGQIGPRTGEELAALERLEKSPYTNIGENAVNTLAPSVLIGSSSFLQVIRTTIRIRMCLNLAKSDHGLQIYPTLTTELPALERLKK